MSVPTQVTIIFLNNRMTGRLSDNIRKIKHLASRDQMRCSNFERTCIKQLFRSKHVCTKFILVLDRWDRSELTIKVCNAPRSTTADAEYCKKMAVFRGVIITRNNLATDFQFYCLDNTCRRKYSQLLFIIRLKINQLD